jgi:hypothetical protein
MTAYHRFPPDGWCGIGAPRGTCVEIVERLDEKIVAGVADPEMKARLAVLGGIAVAGSQADCGKLIVDEAEAAVSQQASSGVVIATPGSTMPPRLPISVPP